MLKDELNDFKKDYICVLQSFLSILVADTPVSGHVGNNLYLNSSRFARYLASSSSLSHKDNSSIAGGGNMLLDCWAPQQQHQQRRARQKSAHDSTWDLTLNESGIENKMDGASACFFSTLVNPHLFGGNVVRFRY